MDLEAAKLGVMQKIMNVSKPSLLEKIDKLLEEELIVGHTTDGKPLTRELYQQRLDNAEEEIRNGHYLTQEELEKESENW